MIISALKERKDGEKRVAIVPDIAKKLVNEGHQVFIESGAGDQSFFSDETYKESGAEIMHLDDIVKKTSIEQIIWEAPKKSQQSWFINKFGLNVNLGNISYDDIIPLECLRLGLRADTFKKFL